MAKFNIGDKVQTNIAYAKGFDDNVCSPQGMNWLKNLTIKNIIPIDIDRDTHSQYSGLFLYECISKGGSIYHLNECFLEGVK